MALTTLTWGVEPAAAVGPNPTQVVRTSSDAAALAQSLVGAGVQVGNAVLTGAAGAAGTFAFQDPSVIGFGQGLVLGSGSVADVVGPNTYEDTTTDWGGAGDADLTALAGYDSLDAVVLEFDFVPTANQVVFQYAFGSEEYSEWVASPFNDVFAFFVNGTNYAEVREVAGDPAAPFVPVAVNNINNGNPRFDPPPPPKRPDLYRDNALVSATPIVLELDGITHVLTFQAPVIPDATNHMKLAIADASDRVLDSAVFIQAGSIVSNENPVADLSLSTESGPAPLALTAIVEGEDPNGLPLTYSLDWGDGTAPAIGSLPDETALVDHTYAFSGHYTVTLQVSNGTLSGTSVEDVEVTGDVQPVAPVVTLDPVGQTVEAGDTYTFSAAATGSPDPTVIWQSSTDGGTTFTDVVGETTTTLTGTAALADDGTLFRAVFSNLGGTKASVPALLTVTDTTAPTLAPAFGATMPFLRGAVVGVSANASDASGIASESCDPVVTTAAGAFTLVCRATDNAGNTASVTVPYTVGFGFEQVSPPPGTSFRRTASIPVAFQLVDANGLLTDVEAAGLRSAVTVAFDGRTGVHPSYDKRRDQFTASLKTGKPAAGGYDITITVVVGGATVVEHVLTVTVL